MYELVEVLERVMKNHGWPRTIRVDNGPEFISKDIDLWAYWNHVTILDFSCPGKPTDNASIESFNGRFRQECLNEHWFLSFWMMPATRLKLGGGIITNYGPTALLAMRLRRNTQLKASSKRCFLTWISRR